MGAVGQQLLQGYGSMSQSSKSNVNFVTFMNEIEEEINETRKEL